MNSERKRDRTFKHTTDGERDETAPRGYLVHKVSLGQTEDKRSHKKEEERGGYLQHTVLVVFHDFPCILRALPGIYQVPHQ